MKGSVILAGLASFLYASDPAVEGPILGHISSGSTVRSVLGIVAASRLSSPVASKLNRAVVLPGANTAFGINESGVLVRVDLRDGFETALNVTDVISLTASPGGETALAVSGGRAKIFSKDGARIADLALPDAFRTIVIADRGPAVAVIVAESDGEALYLVTERASRRLLHSSRFPALAFLPNSTDIVVSDETGVISRFENDLRLTHLGSFPGTRALAGTADSTRLLIVSDRAIRSVHLGTGEETSLDCKCPAEVALPLGESRFLLTTGDDGAIWLVDASKNELRLAFIPEAVNE